MFPGVTAPSSVRLLNDDEWAIVTRVFGWSNLPFQARIFITDGTGLGGAPFTIPTSAITTVFGTLVGALTIIGALAGVAGGYLASAVNLGFLMNVGPTAFPDMSKSYQSLLVHETTHVWQGRNSLFALSSAIDSMVAQCGGMISSGGGLAGRGAAYSYDPAHLRPWILYNAEQQAKIVEDWFSAGEPTTGDVYTRFIEHRIRVGWA
jgi:hypothetical protein